MTNARTRSRPSSPSSAATHSAWDPLAGPYITRPCRTGNHDTCPRGLSYYPDGWEGAKVDVVCACEQPDCACTRVGR